MKLSKQQKIDKNLDLLNIPGFIKDTTPKIECLELPESIEAAKKIWESSEEYKRLMNESP